MRKEKFKKAVIWTTNRVRLKNWVQNRIGLTSTVWKLKVRNQISKESFYVFNIFAKFLWNQSNSIKVFLKIDPKRRKNIVKKERVKGERGRWEKFRWKKRSQPLLQCGNLRNYTWNQFSRCKFIKIRVSEPRSALLLLIWMDFT